MKRRNSSPLYVD